MKRLTWLLSGIILFSAAAVYGADTLPRPDPAFKGKIDPSRDKSSPDWPQRPTATKGAPNVILILLDDVGFGPPLLLAAPCRRPHWTNWPKAASVTIGSM